MTAVQVGGQPDGDAPTLLGDDCGERAVGPQGCPGSRRGIVGQNYGMLCRQNLKLNLSNKLKKYRHRCKRKWPAQMFFNGLDFKVPWVAIVKSNTVSRWSYYYFLFLSLFKKKTIFASMNRMFDYFLLLFFPRPILQNCRGQLIKRVVVVG